MENNKSWKGCGKLENLCIAGETENGMAATLCGMTVLQRVNNKLQVIPLLSMHPKNWKY